MPSNSCPLCDSYLKDVFDDQLARGVTPSIIVAGIDKRVSRTLGIKKAIDERYEFRGSRNVLNDKDRNELSWIVGEVNKKLPLLSISEEDISEHRNHMSYCSHLHDMKVKCDVHCEHVSRYDAEIVIDGVVVLKDIIEYQDKRL